MDEEQLEAARERLLRLRLEVMREVRNAVDASREMGQDSVPDIGDMSANTYSRDVLLNLSENQRQKIRDIDVALERLAQGEYGICARCGDEIAPRRMEVRPFSRYCIDCKTDVEKFGE
jgi:DnaK suppressor protein